MSGTRTLSAMTLFFFVWMTLYPAMAAAVAAVPAPSVTPAVAQPAPDTLESLRGLSQHAHAKTEAGEDSGTEVKQLLQHAAQLDGEQQRAEAGFAADRQHLEERHLPDIIRERHAQALADYRANMQQLRQQLTDFKAAHDRKDAAAARRHLKSLAQFLDKAQKHRQHLPFDADNLPSAAPNRKTRAPKTSRRDLDGILHPPKPVAVAANELTPGMLATDDPGPTPTAADLAATEDAPLSTAVKAQAAALHNNPVAIYNWVRNTVEFQPTYGGIQNADQTLQTRRGNAADTASLLVALLRAANIPARYAYGTVQIPAAQVMNWVGSVGTPEAAQSLLNQGGIPNSAVVSGGAITAFKLEHVWVEAFVDYFPSRGAVNKVGDTWVPLDASFKQRGGQNGLDLTAAVPLNAQAVTDTAKAAAQCGPDSAQALDSAPVADAFADYSLRLNRYLAAQSPDLSLTDILGTHTITAARYPILLGSLPYATVSQATVTATYPDSLRWRLRYAVYASELERGQNRPALILDNSLAALGGQRVTLSFTPATAADQSALDSFMPAPHPDGSPIEAAEFPASLPGYLIHVRAELKVGGTTVASGGDFQLGQPLLGSLGHFDPAAAVWHDSAHALSAGEYHALAIDGAGIAAAQLDALAQTAAATVDKAGQGDFTAADRDSLVGGYLHQAVLADFALADAHNTLAADAAAIAAVPLPSYGRAALQLAPTLLFGSVRQARFLGTALHADRRAASLAPKTATSLPLPAYQRQSLQRASADSQQILQRLLTDGQRLGEPVSAVKALATAIRQGIPLLGLDSANAAAQLPQLGLDDSTKTDLANAVNSGFQALAQQTPVTLGGYVGGGYRLDNPQTGAGAYRLSTEQAGGADGLLFGSAGLGHLSMASAQQAATAVSPALQAAHDLDSQLAALLPDRTGASQLRWSTYPAQSGIVSALFLTQLANQPYRDACNQATAFLAADLAASAGLPANAANHPPAITSAPLTVTAANQPYRYTVQATDSDGDPLSYRLPAAPGGMTVGSDGLLAWDNPVPGNYPIRLRVDDGQAYTEQTYTLSVGTAPAVPSVQLSVSPAVVNLGDSILVKITVLGGDLSQATLSVDGVPQALDSKGQARLSAAASGTHLLVASLGGVSQQSQYSVRAPDDSTAPTAILTAPDQDAEITRAVNFTGTAADANFAYYRLLIRPAGDPNDAWQELSRRYQPVNGGTLGSLDPSQLPNGLYDVALQVFDSNGLASLTGVPVEVRGDLKLGPFQIAFEDLSTEAAGIPVRVVRRYDSLKRNQNQDFGFGWSVDYQNAAVRKNMTLGLGWEITNIFTQFKLCLSPAGNRKVAVTLPDGKVERFVAYNDPECTTFMVPPLNVKFTAQPGTTSRLEVLDSTALVQSEGGMLLDYSNGLPWNPKHFKLTTEDGTAYYLTEGVGLEKVQDPFGNTLTYSKNGIVHSAGLSVAFQRDGQGRITRITDPQGQSLQYAYTPQGELAAHTDRSGQTDSFRYGGGHLLAAYTDPRGITTASQDYDSQGRLSAVTDADGHRTQLGFDDTANRQTVTDRLGHRTTYTYDDSGNVTAVTDALGNTTASTYDPLGNETATTDPLGHTTVRTYSPLSQQLSETDPLGHTQTWRYGIGTDPHPLASHQDPLGNSTQYSYYGTAPTGISEPLGRTTSLSYDGQGNLTALGLPGGQTSAYTYNAQGQRTSETDPAGHTTTYRLDADGREIGRTWTRTANGGSVITLNSQRGLDPEGRALSDTDPTGATTTRQYNGAGKVSQETDPLGRTTTYTYDNQARLIQTAYPDGSSAAQGYDADGNLIAESDRAGRITRHTYDSLNRPVQTVRPDGGSETTAYDPAGHVTQSTDALGHTTTYTYDPAGRLTRSADPLGHTTAYQYDANGNRTQSTAPDGQTTAYTYDALNRLVKTTYPDGTSSQTDWRSDGLKQAETAPDGSVRRYAYDSAGCLTQVTEHNGGETTTYRYDEAGNKTAQTDAQGRTTRWDYDNANRPVRRTLPGGGQETYQYDIAGRLTAHSRFSGQLTRYAYDSSDRPSQTAYPDGQSPSWTYSPDGLPASATDSHNRPTAYQYGSQGQRRQETRPDGTVLVWDTDAQGNTTARTTPTGTHRYAYDAAGRLTQATDQHNQITTYTYDPVGRPLNQTRPNGSQTTRRYDANGRLTQLLHTAPDGTLTSGTAYRLAPDGRRTTQTDYDNQSALDGNGQPQNPLRSTAYTYDASGRLTHADTTARDGQTRLIGYTYDPTGNRQQQQIITTAAQTQTQTTTYTYDADDRLTQETTITADNTNSTNTSSQTTTYTWDTDGRLTQKQSPADAILYTYDSQDRLTGVKRGADPASAQTVATYAYDADGNRSQKTVKTAQGDQVTTYLTDNTFAYPQVAEETTTLGNTTQTTRYLWADGQLIAATQSTSINGNRQPPTTRYYHSDGLGSITALTDSQGNLTDTYAYRPFGETTEHNGTSQQPYRFAGEHLDPEAAMQYHRARWYDPNTGRFTALDPYDGNPSRPATLNKYAYAGGDPVNGVDPGGEMTLSQVGTSINVASNLYTAASLTVNILSGNYGVAGGMTKQIAEEIVFSKLSYLRPVAKLSDEAVALFVRIWGGSIKLKLGYPKSGLILRENMEAILGKAPAGYEAHHLVGMAYAEGKMTAPILQSHGIDINSVMNGVFLPGHKLKGNPNNLGPIHQKHAQAYEVEVYARINAVRNDRMAIINVLNDIRADILSGKLPLN